MEDCSHDMESDCGNDGAIIHLHNYNARIRIKMSILYIRGQISTSSYITGQRLLTRKYAEFSSILSQSIRKCEGKLYATAEEPCLAA